MVGTRVADHAQAGGVRWTPLPHPTVLLEVGHELQVDPARWAALPRSQRDGIYRWAHGGPPPAGLRLRARGLPAALAALEQSLAAIEDEVWQVLLAYPAAAGPPGSGGRSPGYAPGMSGGPRARVA